MEFINFKTKYHYDIATPVMQQYLNLKFAHLDCLLLFRMGDFYELFYEDAIIVSKILGIALTKRGKTGEDDIPMCGVPYHALETYLHKLVEEEFKIAICEQLETPEEAKKRGGYKAVVNREVIRIITPGTVIEESLISTKLPNYLASIVLANEDISICYVDITTGELNIIEICFSELLDQLALINPKEILVSDKLRENPEIVKIKQNLNTRISFQVDSFFATAKCENIILEYYELMTVESICNLSNLQISSLGSILEYITLTQKSSCPKLSFPKIINLQNFIKIDTSTRRNLEIITSQCLTKQGSLLSTIDYTCTKQGARLLYNMLNHPLNNITEINSRLDLCEFFVNNIALNNSIRELLPNISDLERIITRIQMKKSNPRDLLGIKYTLENSLKIKKLFVEKFGLNPPEFLYELTSTLSGDEGILTLINESIKLDAPVSLADGGFIKLDFHAKIKELYDYLHNGNEHIENLKRRYQTETGIENLKISHNNMLGLFIEVTPKANTKIANHSKFVHKQTTANSVRYTTSELQQLEMQIITARSQVINLEQELYYGICNEILQKSIIFKNLSYQLSKLDVFSGLAFLAYENSWSKPTLTLDNDFHIKAGRHPVIEKALIKSRKNFIANDCSLSNDERIWLLTGPNMAGKSTFLKQNAIIAILAHIGSFIPAESAKIGIIDKIYSRIGAGDNLLKGESTFMVEMIETSAILAQSTNKSLIILDEVGRGTSTYDGVSIAWAVLEHIHDKSRCRCIFATHYFELINLSNFLPALKNYTIAIEEIGDKILFLHKIIKGSADKSYGIHVAELAGLPKSVISRASEILDKFEKNSSIFSKRIIKNESNNLSLFSS